MIKIICPKCESVNIDSGWHKDYMDYECLDCNHLFDYDDTKEYKEKAQKQIEYHKQQRLNKVLEKFEERCKPKQFKSYYNFRCIKKSMFKDEEVCLFTVRYSKDKGFYFVGGGGTQIISLDTVEHLIADIEASQ